MMDPNLKQVLRHRLLAHQAALRAAEALGWPAALATQVAVTQTRLDELCAIVDELERYGVRS